MRNYMFSLQQRRHREQPSSRLGYAQMMLETYMSAAEFGVDRAVVRRRYLLL